ncbi:MAG: diguanylate cyclase [Gammaproteobacteria bacterium]|jgi:diguanylate cyclase (GGDEF)-like protein/PAS domain S-box-containing protein|nr:diguanylate cyclase [Gammaproteobacteria bacterium]
MDIDQPTKAPAFPLTPDQVEEMLDAAERMAQLGHWFLDVATQRPIWSKQVFAIFRRDPELGEPLISDLRRYLHAEDWPQLKQAIDACGAHGTPYDLTFRIRRDDASEGHARVYGTAMRETDGSIRKLAGFIQDVTAQQAVNTALREREANYRLLVEQQTDLIVKVDAAGRFLFVSPAYCRTFAKGEHELLGRKFMPLVHPEDRAQTERAMADLYRPPHQCYLEQRAMTSQGWRWLGWSDSAILDEQGQVTAIVGVGRDIHERKLAELALSRAQRMLDLALESGGIGTFTADFKTGEVSVDERYLEQLGYKPGELEVDYDWWLENVHPDDIASFADQTDQVLYGGLDDFTAEYRIRHRDGHWVWVQDHARVYERDADGAALAATGLHIDITRRKEAELKLAYNADHDPLTDLLNRRGMWRAIRRIHAQCTRGHHLYCIAILDLDHFKQVNDTYGHVAGDALLREIARLLSSQSREADWIARWGGEEFLILMPDTDIQQGRVLIERLHEQIAQAQFQVEGHALTITSSAGLAACALGSDSQDAVVNRADRALYAAKQAGRNRVCDLTSSARA